MQPRPISIRPFVRTHTRDAYLACFVFLIVVIASMQLQPAPPPWVCLESKREAACY